MTGIDMGGSRKEFEEYIAKKLRLPFEMIAETRNGDRYFAFSSMDTRRSLDEWWALWQASRAAIGIAAPKFIDSREALAKGSTVDCSNGFDDTVDTYEENIRAAGVKVKE